MRIALGLGMALHAALMVGGLIAVLLGADHPECWLAIIVVNGVFLRCTQHAREGK